MFHGYAEDRALSTTGDNIYLALLHANTVSEI